jgi:DNA mismatch repair protein MutS2
MTSKKVLFKTDVLAVLSMYRRKVKGSILGSSKQEVSYIEPETTLKYSRELSNLDEETEEINRILKQLSNDIRPLPLLIQYQDFSDIDVIAAKAKYANRINGIMPAITNNRRLYFRDAYHLFCI